MRSYDLISTCCDKTVAPGEKWCQGKLEFMLSQRGKPLLVHDGHTFGIQYIRKDKKYWQCNLSRKFNCKARVTTTETGEIIVTNNEHCHTEIRQHLRKDYKGKMQHGVAGGCAGSIIGSWPFKNETIWAL